MIKLTDSNLIDIYENHVCSHYTTAINDILNKYSITTHDQICVFLATLGVESANLTVKIENLNYSEHALEALFSRHFKIGEGAVYAHHPEMIANRVYADRMGNGPEASGDGWKYRGRGFIQLTGKFMYETALKAFPTLHTLDDLINYLETDYGAVDIAGWYWQYRGCNRFDDIYTITRLINGGLTDIDKRVALYNKAWKIVPYDQPVANTLPYANVAKPVVVTMPPPVIVPAPTVPTTKRTGFLGRIYDILFRNYEV